MVVVGMLAIVMGFFLFGNYAHVFQLRSGCSKKDLAVASPDSPAVRIPHLYCMRATLFDLWSRKTA